MFIFSEMKETFDLFDVDRDGMISTSELEKVFESLGMTPSRKELDDVITRLDVDGELIWQSATIKMYSVIRQYKVY